MLTLGSPFEPTTDDVRMIEAPSRRNGNAFCTVKTAPLTLMPKVRLNSSSLISPSGAASAIPAFANAQQVERERRAERVRNEVHRAAVDVIHGALQMLGLLGGAPAFARRWRAPIAEHVGCHDSCARRRKRPLNGAKGVRAVRRAMEKDNQIGHG